MMVVNFWVGPGFYVPLHLGTPASALPRMFADTVPATLCMVVLARPRWCSSVRSACSAWRPSH